MHDACNLLDFGSNIQPNQEKDERKVIIQDHPALR
jgi:hypothetical protein